MKHNFTELVSKGARFGRLLNREKMLVAMLREVRDEQREMMQNAETEEELTMYTDLLEKL